MLTPSELVHLHLLLNHFPTVGMIVGFGVFLLALVKKSEDLKRGDDLMFCESCGRIVYYNPPVSIEPDLAAAPQ